MAYELDPNTNTWQRLAQQVGAAVPKTETIGPKELGWTEQKFSKFMEVRKDNPTLTPDAFDAAEKAKVKVDWKRVNQALENGKQAAIDKDSEVFNAYLQDLKDLLSASDETAATAASRISQAQSAEGFAKQFPEYAEQARLMAQVDADSSALRGGTAAAYQRWLAANPFIKDPLKSKPVQQLIQTKTITPEQVRVNTVAATVLATTITNVTRTQAKTDTAKKTAAEFEKELRRQINKIPDEKLQSAVQTSIKQATEQKTDQKSMTETATKTATEQKTATKTETKQQTNTQKATQTKTDLQQKTATQTNLQTNTSTITPTQTITTDGGNFKKPPKDDEPTKKKIKLPSLGGSDKDKRKFIQRADGAIGWRQGELHGKDRWDVITNIYKLGQEQYVIVMGDKPKGATMVKGPGSAFKTAQLLYGKKQLARTAVIDQPGLFTTRLDPLTGKRIRISFEHDANISKRGTVFPLGRRNNAPRMT